METNSAETPPPEQVLSGVHRDLYEHLKYVLEHHLASLRLSPITGDIVEETAKAFDVLDALVEDLKVPKYDLATAEGRLLNAVAQLNKTMPGVALRTLSAVYHYLATSDDDGIITRQKAMCIIQELGLPDGSLLTGKQIMPPLP